MDNNMQIGAVTGPHGIKGEIKVFPTTFDMKRYSLLEKIALSTRNDPDRLTTYRIEGVKYQKKTVILKLCGVDDMDAAALLKGSVITVPKSLALPLDADEYYIGDILGCTVVTTAGETLGELTDILETGANDVYTVKKPDGGEMLLPAVKHVIIRIDTAAKIMTVEPPEGL